MPVFFTPFMITRLALMADLSPVSAPVETAPVSAPVETAPVETAPVETAPVETAPVETASMKMTKAELQALATQRNIKFAKGWPKAKLVEAINA